MRREEPGPGDRDARPSGGGGAVRADGATSAWQVRGSFFPAMSPIANERLIPAPTLIPVSKLIPASKLFPNSLTA